MASLLQLMFLATPIFAGGEPASATHKADQQITKLLAPIRDKHKLPGLVAGIVRGDELIAVGAVGVRKIGSPESIEVDDQIHIGSDTKAMTATCIAILVEQGKLKWDSTIAGVFPRLKDGINADYHDVTLVQLLTHRAGLPADPFSWWLLGAKKPTPEQRITLLKQVLKNAPETKPGTKFGYSNVGYGVAAAMAEKVTGKSWEDLMRDRLFKPLGMRTAGFGAPGTKDKADQPWGHKVSKDERQPSQVDNAPVLGPAGTVHCSLPDWAKFTALHLEGRKGKSKMLKAETIRYLHTPPAGQEYACGWGALKRQWAGGTALMHSGSNSMWWATVWIAPERDFAVLAVTNCGGDPGQNACDDTCAVLIEQFDKRFAKKR
jgi:CubicO group peptidase (beta-lactamase class C family)